MPVPCQRHMSRTVPIPATLTTGPDLAEMADPVKHQTRRSPESPPREYRPSPRKIMIYFCRPARQWTTSSKIAYKERFGGTRRRPMPLVDQSPATTPCGQGPPVPSGKLKVPQLGHPIFDRLADLIELYLFPRSGHCYASWWTVRGLEP